MTLQLCRAEHRHEFGGDTHRSRIDDAAVDARLLGVCADVFVLGPVGSASGNLVRARLALPRIACAQHVWPQVSLCDLSARFAFGLLFGRGLAVFI